MEETSKTGGSTGSVTPSTALLNRKLAISNAPRMLKPSEIELLQQSKKEMAERYYVQAILARAQVAVSSWAHWEAINDHLARSDVREALSWFNLAGSAGIGTIRMAHARDALLGTFRLTDPIGQDRITLCQLAKWLEDKNTAEILASKDWAAGQGCNPMVVETTAARNAERIERLKSLVPSDWKESAPTNGELLRLRKILRPMRDHLAHALQGDTGDLPCVDEYRRLIMLTLELATDAAFIWMGSAVSAENIQEDAREQAESFWQHAFAGPIREWSSAIEQRRAAGIEL